MTIPSADEELLSKRRLLEEGKIELFHSELNRDFRFPRNDQGPWLKIESESIPAQIYYSEKGTRLDQALELVTKTLATESGSDDGSKYRIVGASEILKNAAWYDGPHLAQVVIYAGIMMGRKYPLMARENAADALKNAASYPGGHVEEAVKYALRGTGPTDRIASGCARTILYAAKHSRNLLQNEDTREFLDFVSRNKNPIISAYAAKARVGIFGK